MSVSLPLFQLLSLLSLQPVTHYPFILPLPHFNSTLVDHVDNVFFSSPNPTQVNATQPQPNILFPFSPFSI